MREMVNGLSSLCRHDTLECRQLDSREMATAQIYEIFHFARNGTRLLMTVKKKQNKQSSQIGISFAVTDISVMVSRYFVVNIKSPSISFQHLMLVCAEFGVNYIVAG